jgi:predicted MFS family arabinose efflux permease
VVAIALGIVVLAYAVFWGFGFHLIGLIVGVILLDGGVQAAQVANQYRVFALRPDARNRVNTIYMICYFGGGSLGSLAAAWAWSRWQWNGVCAVAIAFIVVGILLFVRRVPDAAGVVAR